jgi:hypothetical protein
VQAPEQIWILPLWQWAAFWVAVLAFRSDHALRFVLGLGLGAILARLGWALLHFAQVFFGGFAAAWLAEPAWGGWLGPEAGFSVLFVPVGSWVFVPWSHGFEARRRYAAAACRALAPGFAVARLGCVWAGCCSGEVLGGEPGVGFAHPTALYELLGWALATPVLARIPSNWVPGFFLMIFGGLRLATEPLRAPPPLGAPDLDPVWIALAWFGIGLLELSIRLRTKGDRLGDPTRLRTK